MDPLTFGEEGAVQESPAVPPPPYESVIGASSHGTIPPVAPALMTSPPAGVAAAPQAPPLPVLNPPPAVPTANGSPTVSSSAFEIAVCDPVKQGEGVAAFVSYKVRTRTSLSQYNRPTCEVVRRFRDFCHLETLLAERHRGIILPPLPEKNAVQKFQNSPEFLEERRRALQVFINRIAAHPALSGSAELQLFLEASEDAWAAEMARAQAAAPTGSVAGTGTGTGTSSSTGTPGTAARKTLEGAVGWLRGLGAAASNVVAGAGRAADAAEEPEYIKVRDYLVSLESHLAEAHRQAARLAAREVEYGEAALEFGQAMEKLGRLEQGNVSEACAQLSLRAAELVAARRRGCEELVARFEAPLKEAVRGVRCATAVCADRGNALSTHLAAKAELDARKVRWAKLRGTPGSGPDKLAEAERDISDSEARVRDTRIVYESLVATMTEELHRWQRERAADMTALLRDFALSQTSMASEGVRAWSGLLAELQAVAGGGDTAVASVPPASG